MSDRINSASGNDHAPENPTTKSPVVLLNSTLLKFIVNLSAADLFSYTSNLGLFEISTGSCNFFSRKWATRNISTTFEIFMTFSFELMGQN